jgi:hypothetical protein
MIPQSFKCSRFRSLAHCWIIFLHSCYMFRSLLMQNLRANQKAAWCNDSWLIFKLSSAVRWSWDVFMAWVSERESGWKVEAMKISFSGSEVMLESTNKLKSWEKNTFTLNFFISMFLVHFYDTIYQDPGAHLQLESTQNYLFQQLS